MTTRSLAFAAVVVILGTCVMQVAALKNQPPFEFLSERMKRDPQLRLTVLAEIAGLKGKQSDVVVQRSLFRLFPPLLTWTQPQELVEALEESAPVRADGGSYFGSGCRSHRCGTSEAAWLIDGQTGVATAALMGEAYDPGVLPRMKQFQFFGPPYEHLPGPIEAWARARGMTREVELDRYGFARIRIPI